MSDARFDEAVAQSGRTVVGRLLPGTDLIRGLEAVCDEHGLEYAAIAFAYGSLSQASFNVLHRPEGGEPATLVPYLVDDRVEFLGGQGLVCRGDDGERATHLHGSISDHLGVVRGGHFVPDQNPIYNNLDFLLTELLGVDLLRTHDAETNTVEMVVTQLGSEAGTEASSDG